MFDVNAGSEKSAVIGETAHVCERSKPEQSTVHGTRCDDSPTQGAPPLTGAGLLQVLVRL